MALVEQDTKYSWFISSFGAVTAIFAIGIPFMCMPVLFNEISRDLNLSLVQIGVAWGMGGLASMFMSPFGGLIGDRFGAKRTLLFSCIMLGIAGAGRGISMSFFGLALGMFCYGIFLNTAALNLHKTSGLWFSGKRVVIANGLISSGMALGMFLGALISDTLMSPLLGGWRNVLLTYGAVSVFVGLLWSITKNEPTRYENSMPVDSPSFRKTIKVVIREKNIWIFSLAHLCYAGCLMGTIGYLPLYLRGIGWAPVNADGVLAALNGAGLVGAFPISLLSAKFRLRKSLVIPVFFLTLSSAALLPVSHGIFIWIFAIIMGMLRDGYVAVLMTMVMESRGIGTAYAGTSMGLIFSLGNLGNFISSPTGNRLAVIHPTYAFLFWASLIGIAILIFSFYKEETG